MMPATEIAPPPPTPDLEGSSLPKPATLSSTSPSRSRIYLATIQWGWNWLKLNALELVVMAAIGPFTLFLNSTTYFSPPERSFPVEDRFGQVIDPSIAHHWRRWTISPQASGLIALLPPVFIYGFSQLRIRSAWDFSNACIGTAWAVLVSAFVVTMLKTFVGGLRPAFLHICLPNRDSWGKHRAPNGEGYGGTMWTSEICDQEDKWLLRLGMTSFPSGHAAAAWAGWGFLFLWLNGKFKTRVGRKPPLWKLTILSIPLLGSLLVCGTLVLDNAHHWYDIVVGSLIGLVAALAAYRASYASVWGSRYNDAPLIPGKEFKYDKEGDGHYETETVGTPRTEVRPDEKDQSNSIKMPRPISTLNAPRATASVPRAKGREVSRPPMVSNRSLGSTRTAEGDNRTL